MSQTPIGLSKFEAAQSKTDKKRIDIGKFLDNLQDKFKSGSIGILEAEKMILKSLDANLPLNLTKDATGGFTSNGKGEFSTKINARLDRIKELTDKNARGNIENQRALIELVGNAAQSIVTNENLLNKETRLELESRFLKLATKFTDSKPLIRARAKQINASLKSETVSNANPVDNLLGATQKSFEAGADLYELEAKFLDGLRSEVLPSLGLNGSALAGAVEDRIEARKTDSNQLKLLTRTIGTGIRNLQNTFSLKSEFSKFELLLIDALGQNLGGAADGVVELFIDARLEQVEKEKAEMKNIAQVVEANVAKVGLTLEPMQQNVASNVGLTLDELKQGAKEGLSLLEMKNLKANTLPDFSNIELSKLQFSDVDLNSQSKPEEIFEPLTREIPEFTGETFIVVDDAKLSSENKKNNVDLTEQQIQESVNLDEIFETDGDNSLETIELTDRDIQELDDDEFESIFDELDNA
ncbi:MAG: hypothetical protein MK033_10900 [Candidatus Caenarcaniphilales bacterium]|nr:hypothetical protein [Candidatus Caenarcaniphilales bacterium]